MTMQLRIPLVASVKTNPEIIFRWRLGLLVARWWYPMLNPGYAIFTSWTDAFESIALDLVGDDTIVRVRP